MAQTLYASFTDTLMAEKAAGALMDHGAQADDITLISHGEGWEDAESDMGFKGGAAILERPSILVQPGTSDIFGTGAAFGAPDATLAATADPAATLGTPGDEDDGVDDMNAKYGITTTTPQDAGAGAIKGTGIGLGVGAVAALASLFVPGVGLVLGGGALASALGAAALTAGAGAIAGGVTGFLKDQGVPEEHVRHYSDTIEGGGALLTLRLPSGDLNEADAGEIVAKYGGTTDVH